MKKLSLILSVLIGNVAMAQTTSISGQLLDKTTNEALQYANVQIYSLPDSTFLKGDVTKEDGSFRIEGIKAEKCLVRASFIGYIPVDKNINVTKGQNNSVGKIFLLEDSKQLAEVSVQAEATPMTVRDDTVAFNADAASSGWLFCKDSEILRSAMGCQAVAASVSSFNSSNCKSIVGTFHSSSLNSSRTAATCFSWRFRVMLR